MYWQENIISHQKESLSFKWNNWNSFLFKRMSLQYVNSGSWLNQKMNNTFVCYVDISHHLLSHVINMVWLTSFSLTRFFSTCCCFWICYCRVCSSFSICSSVLILNLVSIVNVVCFEHLQFLSSSSSWKLSGNTSVVRNNHQSLVLKLKVVILFHMIMMSFGEIMKVWLTNHSVINFIFDSCNWYSISIPCCCCWYSHTLLSLWMLVIDLFLLLFWFQDICRFPFHLISSSFSHCLWLHHLFWMGLFSLLINKHLDVNKLICSTVWKFHSVSISDLFDSFHFSDCSFISWLFLFFLSIFWFLIHHMKMISFGGHLKTSDSFPFIPFISFLIYQFEYLIDFSVPIRLFSLVFVFFLVEMNAKQRVIWLWIFPLDFIVSNNDEREMWSSRYFVSFSFSSMIFPMSCIEERNTCCHPHFSLSVFWFVNSLK